jgi:integrase
MAVFQRGTIWWYKFRFEGKRIQESAKTENKQEAKRAEEERRRELRDAFMGTDTRKQRARTIKELGDEYLDEHKKRRPKSQRFVTYALMHVVEYLGKLMVAQIDLTTVKKYQSARLDEDASAKTINGEVTLLLRIMEQRGDQLRVELKRKHQLHLKVNDSVGKAYSVTEQDKLLAAAKSSRSPNLYFALNLALNGGMRDAEIKTLRWSQIDFAKNLLIVGEAKTQAGSGRIVPLNGEILEAFTKHREWYVKKFGDLKAQWFVFPFGRRGRLDPTRGVTTLKSAWTTVREKAGVQGRWHDARHTVVTQLGESGASAATIMASVGHVSRRMLERYSHPNLEAQRRAFEQMVEYRNQQREREAAAAQQFEDKPEKPATVN